MEQIEAILQLRKNYVLKLYEFFNAAHPVILPLRHDIKKKTDQLLKEELTSFNNWQTKIEKLNRFNSEIQAWIQKNQGKALDDKKNTEINYLKNSFEHQVHNALQHYLLTFSILNKSRQKWMAELSYEFLQMSNRDSEITKLHREVAKTYPELNHYCTTWKGTTIEKINKLVRSSYDIEQLCDSVQEDIEYIRRNMNDEFLTLDDEAKKYPEKRIKIAENCETLSQKLESFMLEQDLYAALNKINVEEQDFKKEFLDIFGGAGFNSIRTTIRLVNKLAITEKKLQMIKGYFQKIQLTLQPELHKILNKKNKLLVMCTDASELGRLTITKWIEFNYTDIFKEIDNVIGNREKFLPQSSFNDND